MPPVIGTDSFHVTEYGDALNGFHLAFGRTLGQWALIEERLSYWLEFATGLPYEMSRAMFFAPRTFSARTDLLEAALKHNIRLCQCADDFIKAATTKAGKYSSFRNQLAHGEQTFDARGTSPTFKQVILISGKRHPHKAADTAITIGRLEIANGNFRELTKLLMDVSEFVHGQAGPTRPVECLQLMYELPNQADYLKPDPIPPRA
jgi:hypothetical protein